MGLIKIMKKSVTEMAEKVGHIFNTTNINDKTKNTYSANVIEQLLVGTTLYESKNFATSGTLSDSITNYKRIKVYAFSSDSHNVVQELLTDQTNADGNLYTSFWAGSLASIADSTYYSKIARLRLNDKTFTLDRYWRFDIKATPSISVAEYNSFIVLKIVGYKY